MKFQVVSVSEYGNLVLSSTENKPVTHKVPVFLQGEKVAEIYDTIGKVDSPLYLAKPKGNGKELVGKELDNKNI